MTENSEQPAIPSASVILTREGDTAEGLEVLMVRRHSDIAFGSADAFPGGKLSSDDASVGPFCSGIDPVQANLRLNVPAGGLHFFSAAIRELFEETGVLLGRRENSLTGVALDALEEQRVALAEGKLRWSRFLRDNQLRIAADELHYISHWETPLGIDPRFSTRFFVAVRPSGQRVRHDGRELVDSRWMSPSRALEAGRNGELNLPFPTARNLELLTGFLGIPELIHWARRQWQNGIDRMRGAFIESGGGMQLVLPGDPGYPEEEA